MKRMLALSCMLAVGCYAAKNLPMSLDTSEGKSVYIPVSSSIELVKERNIQKEDQNSTGHGTAKE